MPIPLQTPRQERQARVNLLIAGLGAILVALSSTGCEPGEPRPSLPAWPGEQLAAARLAIGWGTTYRLEEKARLEAESGVFRTVVFPAGSPTELTCGDGEEPGQRWQIAEPTAIECSVDGPELTLTSSAPVELLQARWADPRRHGSRRLLIVADTLRYDHATPERMPELAARFADGVRFERAYSPAAWTLPAIASLFTGRRPVELRAPDGTLISLPDAHQTLAEELSATGELPVAVVANPTVSYENGYAQGFGLFVAPPASATLAGDLLDARWVNEHALRAAEWFPDLDLFLYLQYMEAHGPYRNHQSGEVLPAPTTGDPEPSPAELAQIQTAYASEARYLSRQLDQLFEDLGPVEQAVFTADHGEELFEHGGWGHGPALWHEVVQVPLWIRGSGLEGGPPGGTVDWPVSLIQLKSFLVDGDRNLLDRPARWVGSESFVHGPPRWAAFQGPRRITWFADQPNRTASSEPVAAWLAANHPRQLIEPLADGVSPEPDPADLRSALQALAGQFYGLRQGLFVFAAGGSFDLTATGVAIGDVLVWGEPPSLRTETTGDGRIALKIRASPAGALLFLPAAEGQDVTLESGVPRIDDRAPLTWPAEGAIAWPDPGRPPEQLQGIEETLERLRALGYI